MNDAKKAYYKHRDPSAFDPFDATEDEPEPSGKGVDIANAVQSDIEARAEMGEEKYGERLRSDNGRDPIVDLYHELLDAAMYIRQLIQERYD